MDIGCSLVLYYLKSLSEICPLDICSESNHVLSLGTGIGKIWNKKSIGIKNIWYRKKYRYRFRFTFWVPSHTAAHFTWISAVWWFSWVLLKQAINVTEQCNVRCAQCRVVIKSYRVCNCVWDVQLESEMCSWSQTHLAPPTTTTCAWCTLHHISINLSSTFSSVKSQGLAKVYKS